MRVIGFFLKLIGVLVIILTILVGLLSFAPKLLGWETATINNDSLDPGIQAGSLVIATEVDCSTLENGDVIMYSTDSTPVTYRVISNNVQEQTVVTRGDADAQEDMQSIPYNQILGKVRFHAPYLGKLLDYFAPLKGKIYAICAFVIGIVLALLGGAASRASRRRKYRRN